MESNVNEMVKGHIYYEVLRGSDRELSPFEEVMFAAMRLKHSKEGSVGSVGHYEIDGYKALGLPGNYVLLAKKMESIRKLCWGPDPKQPTVLLSDLTDQQLEKLFDHLIDAANYSAFGAEMVREMYKGRTSEDLLDRITARKEVG